MWTVTKACSPQGKEQHPTNTKARSNIKLQDAPAITAFSASSDLDSSSAILLNNANISNAAAGEEINEQLPAEDFSATGLDKKRRMVVEAAAHSWRGYEDHAWGFDELQPLTQDGKETLGGLGATIVDSLDTLWLMGLKDQFGRLA